MTLEDETELAVKNALYKMFISPIKVFLYRIKHNEAGKPIMEWDGILLCCNKVFLCKSKHNMTEKQMDTFVKQLKEFWGTKDFEFKQLSDKQYIGVACGSHFPEELRKQSMDKHGLR
ncbi:hypothetical protein C1645_744363 [Glomus cerebriforme]|uniref:Uncharacterized protein n=1 Tax=Glomus cerebriforme TaxID=658196 RepID=A0A397S6P7_9GLOM|nr:hypothetical protein C1645_744363 [Glomus cerebriforme]